MGVLAVFVETEIHWRSGRRRKGSSGNCLRPVRQRNRAEPRTNDSVLGGCTVTSRLNLVRHGLHGGVPGLPILLALPHPQIYKAPKEMPEYDSVL